MVDPSFAPAFALETPTRHGEAVLDWLATSTAQPARFRAVLEQHAHELGVTRAKSDAAIGTDLYYDLVARHLGSRSRALRCYTRAALSGVGRWDEVSFDELHARCTHRMAWWVAQGVSPGAAICVVLPFGIELAVSLLAGLRLGGVVSWLPPQGPAFVRRRIEALAPLHVATEPFLARHLGPFAALVLPPDQLAPAPETASYTYDPGQPCLRWCSPLRAPADEPVPIVEVTAEDVYVGALRDGLVCLALRPRDAVAAPGFHALQHQPALMFAAWITGAAFVHLDEDDAVGQPTLLDATPLRTIGLTAPVRDSYLRERRGHRPPWSHVIRNPEDRCDWTAWQAFIEGCDLGAVPFSNLVMDAASAGALLSSPRRPGKRYLPHLQDVMPAPGRPWQLLDFTGTGQPSAADAGVYAPLGPGKKPKPIEPRYLVIARRGVEYLYGGTMQPRRVGRVYPADELLELLAVPTSAELPRAPWLLELDASLAVDAGFLDGAAVVPITSGGAASEVRFVLVGFTGDEEPTAFDDALEPRRAALRRLITIALGADLVPDRIELFPLYARPALGPAWIEGQYLGGLAFRKAAAPLMQRLGALRRAVRIAAAPPPMSTSAAETSWP